MLSTGSGEGCHFWAYETAWVLVWWKSLDIPNCQAREMGPSVREAEHRIDVELFLNEYPRWELGTPPWSVILHEMFLHAAEIGQKEAERMVCWGH